MKIGLALSGGGFRASLYHLGLVRFLRDAGILPHVTHITAVSGGSIIAAHLGLNWGRYTGSASEFDAAASELLAFVRLDIRNRILRRYGLGFALRGPRRLIGLSNRRLTRTGLLEYHYERYLYGDTSLFQLPETPRLHLLATNLSEGRLCSFQRDGLWMIRRRADNAFRTEHFRIGLATVPMAVAASSAFPGFFPPMELTGPDVGARSGEFGRQAFTDGGVFDNLGVRMFRFLAQSSGTEHPPWDGVLVSDVGKQLEIQASARAGGLIRTAMRSSDILMDRVWQLENETLKETPGFVFARITDAVDPEHDPTALHPEIQQRLPSIRTDLDRFSELEISSLIRQGYCVGRHTCRAHPSVFGANLPQNPPWDPIFASNSRTPAATEVASASRNGRESTAITQDARALYASAVRRIWSTLLDYRDWVSYVYVPIIVPLLVLLPYFVIKSYQRSQRVGQIVESLAQGSRDLEQMTRLMDSKSIPFNGVPFEQVDKAIESDRTGFEILQDSRIMDFRSWKPGAADSLSFGYRRLKVLKRPDHFGDNFFYANLIADHPQTKVRFPPQELQPKLLRANLGSADSGEKKYRWQAAYDFQQVPNGDSVDLILEYYSPGHYLRHSENGTTLPIQIRTTTAEFIAWIMLPAGKEYKNWRLVRYPTGQPQSAERVKVVTEYLANDSTILAFKMLSLKPGYTYEITWFYR